ncbi:hypothetical protein OAG36_00510 [bacterium]|nr:hypothetical protein [bacterium]
MANTTLKVQGSDGNTKDVLLHTVDGETHVIPVYKTDDNNAISTTSFNSRDAATLAAGATFQGVGEDVSKYGRAGISISSDNATDGILTIQTSHDGVTYGGPTRDFADTTVAAPHMWNIVEQYFRIKYVNGTTEATNLSIQVQYSSNADILLAHQLDEILPLETESIIVRPGTHFDLDVARQHITGQRSFFFFGFNNAVGTSWEDLWPAGGNINWQTAAAKVKIASSDAADNGTTPGLGVHSVEIHGLSATGVDQDEIILTNGTTPVESTLSYVRVNKMHSEMCGTYGGSHQGDIECRVTNAVFANGALLAKMTGVEGSVDTAVVYGSGEAGNGFWSVPLGKVAYITRLEVIPDTATNKDIDIALYEREDILDVTTPFAPRRVLWSESAVNSTIEHEFKSHIKIKALTDIWFRARTVSSGTSLIEVNLDFYLVDANSNGA